MRRDRQTTDGNHPDCVAIIGRLGNDISADVAASSRAVVQDDRLEKGGQIESEQILGYMLQPFPLKKEVARGLQTKPYRTIYGIFEAVS